MIVFLRLIACCFKALMIFFAVGAGAANSPHWLLISIFGFISSMIIANLAERVILDVELFGKTTEKLNVTDEELIAYLRNQQVYREPRNSRALREKAADRIESLREVIDDLKGFEVITQEEECKKCDYIPTIIHTMNAGKFRVCRRCWKGTPVE